jgi:N-acetylornithine carbamoyltransferase
MQRFNDLADFSRDEILDLIGLAARLDRAPEPRALEGKVLSLLFLNPSLRTLASFQAAMTRLGGGSFVISPDMSIHGLETRPGIVMDGAAAEHIREAVPVIASYGDAIGIRAFAERRNLDHDVSDREFEELIALTDRPVINMESACCLGRTTQALYRSPCLRRRSTWRHIAAWTSSCFAPRDSHCPMQSWRGRGTPPT